jgi:hypothetical protein
VVGCDGDNRFRVVGGRWCGGKSNIVRKRRVRLLVVRPSSFRGSHGALVVAAIAMVSAASCGTPSDATATAAQLRAYLAAVEPIRLGVNHLLDGADPVLEEYRSHRLNGQQTAAAMGDLERTFAAYALDVSALQPANPTLSRINVAYAHTYILEDSYLSALVAALPDGRFGSLPTTQADQRATIIEWRVQLETIGRNTGVPLPADLQQAGRGEIAPAVTGST